jgi:periplasmic protein CpxP/Spy
MLRQCLLVLLAASLISITAGFAAAQDSPSNNQQSPPAQDNGHWRHGPPDPAQRTQELTKQLKLTSDQQAKVQDIFQSERTQMESLRQDSSLSQQDRHAK